MFEFELEKFTTYERKCYGKLKAGKTLKPREKAAAYKVREAELKWANEMLAYMRREHPFYYYIPNTGDISSERRIFLEKYLNKEDIPQKLEGSIDVHLSTASIRGASGGNQSGKTVTGIIEAIMKVTGEVPFSMNPKSKRNDHAVQGIWKYPVERLKRTGPVYVRYIAEDYQNGILKNLIPAFRYWSPKDWLKNKSFDASYASGEQILRFYHPMTGEFAGHIEFMSNKQDLGSFQGPARQMLIFDEEPDYEVYKENLMRMTTAENIDVLFCMTPTKGLSWTFDLFSQGRDASGRKVEWFQVSSVCNPKANLDALDEIMSEIPSYEERKMRLLGEFISLSGLVYGKLFNHRLHVIPAFEGGCNCGGLNMHDMTCNYRKHLYFMGVDPHMVKDSCASLCFVDREDNFFVDTCYKRGVTTDQLKVDLNKLQKGKRMDFSVFDPSSDSSITVFGGQNIFDLCTTGANRVKRARKADKYQGSIAAGVDTLKRRLMINERTKKPRFFIMDRPENQELITSMRTLQRDSYQNEQIKGKRDKIQEGVHDHHACVRYILQNKLRWKPWQESIPVPQTASMWDAA